MTVLILTRLELNKEWNEKTNSPMFKRKEVEEKRRMHLFSSKENKGNSTFPE